MESLGFPSNNVSNSYEELNQSWSRGANMLVTRGVAGIKFLCPKSVVCYLLEDLSVENIVGLDYVFIGKEILSLDEITEILSQTTKLPLKRFPSEQTVHSSVDDFLELLLKYPLLENLGKLQLAQIDPFPDLYRYNSSGARYISINEAKYVLSSYQAKFPNNQAGFEVVSSDR